MRLVNRMDFTASCLLDNNGCATFHLKKFRPTRLFHLILDPDLNHNPIPNTNPDPNPNSAMAVSCPVPIIWPILQLAT